MIWRFLKSVWRGLSGQREEKQVREGWKKTLKDLQK